MAKQTQNTSGIAAGSQSKVVWPILSEEYVAEQGKLEQLRRRRGDVQARIDALFYHPSQSTAAADASRALLSNPSAKIEGPLSAQEEIDKLRGEMDAIDSAIRHQEQVALPQALRKASLPVCQELAPKYREAVLNALAAIYAMRDAVAAVNAFNERLRINMVAVGRPLLQVGLSRQLIGMLIGLDSGVGPLADFVRALEAAGYSR